MFENPRRCRQARNFTTTVPKILDLKSSSEQILFRKLSLGAPVKSLKGFVDLTPIHISEQSLSPAPVAIFIYLFLLFYV